MKIHLHIDPTYEQIEIHIYTGEYTEDVEQLVKRLNQLSQTTIIGYLDQDIHVVKIEDIYAILSEGAKVYLETDEQEYETKLKLYEVEEQYGDTFVRINKSTLINLHKLQSIQNKFGKVQALLNNGISFPISRKYLKELKKKLGIGREAK